MKIQLIKLLKIKKQNFRLVVEKYTLSYHNNLYLKLLKTIKLNYINGKVSLLQKKIIIFIIKDYIKKLKKQNIYGKLFLVIA